MSVHPRVYKTFDGGYGWEETKSSGLPPPPTPVLEKQAPSASSISVRSMRVRGGLTAMVRSIHDLTYSVFQLHGPEMSEVALAEEERLAVVRHRCESVAGNTTHQRRRSSLQRPHSGCPHPTDSSMHKSTSLLQLLSSGAVDAAAAGGGVSSLAAHRKHSSLPRYRRSSSGRASDASAGGATFYCRICEDTLPLSEAYTTTPAATSDKLNRITGTDRRSSGADDGGGRRRSDVRGEYSRATEAGDSEASGRRDSGGVKDSSVRRSSVQCDGGDSGGASHSGGRNGSQQVDKVTSDSTEHSIDKRTPVRIADGAGVLMGEGPQRRRSSVTRPQGCTHMFCKACLRDYISYHTEDGVVVNKCPLHGHRGCTLIYSDTDISSLTTPEVYRKYQRFRLIKSNDNYRECPHPSCIHIQLGSRASPEMVCQRCGTSYCFLHADAHPTQSCKAYTRARQAAEEADLNTISRTTKPCPNCHTPIEMSGGCNHMRCTHCDHQWCWLCRNSWDHKHFLINVSKPGADIDVTSVLDCPVMRARMAASAAQDPPMDMGMCLGRIAATAAYVSFLAVITLLWLPLAPFYFFSSRRLLHNRDRTSEETTCAATFRLYVFPFWPSDGNDKRDGSFPAAISSSQPHGHDHNYQPRHHEQQQQAAMLLAGVYVTLLLPVTMLWAPLGLACAATMLALKYLGMGWYGLHSSQPRDIIIVTVLAPMAAWISAIYSAGLLRSDQEEGSDDGDGGGDAVDIGRDGEEAGRSRAGLMTKDGKQFTAAAPLVVIHV